MNRFKVGMKVVVFGCEFTIVKLNDSTAIVENCKSQLRQEQQKVSLKHIRPFVAEYKPKKVIDELY